jgi:hypothetical protein
MSALLKQKAKIGVEQKPRRSVELSNVLKRFKHSEPVVYPPEQPLRGAEEPKEQKKDRKIIKPKMLDKYDEEMKK